MYSFVPSIGSINQKTLNYFFLRSTVSETIGMFGVNLDILSVIISFTRSPLPTGDLSPLISIFKPLS